MLQSLKEQESKQDDKDTEAAAIVLWQPAET